MAYRDSRPSARGSWSQAITAHPGAAEAADDPERVRARRLEHHGDRSAHAAPRRSRTSGGRWRPRCTRSRPIRSAASPIRPRQGRVVQQRAERRRQSGGSRGGTSRPVSPSRTASGRAVHRRRDHRAAAVHRLADHRRQALAERGQHEDVAGATSPSPPRRGRPCRRSGCGRPRPSSAARRSRPSRISPIPAATSQRRPARPAGRGCPSPRPACPRPCAAPSLPTYEITGPSAGTPSRRRASAAVAGHEDRGVRAVRHHLAPAAAGWPGPPPRRRSRGSRRTPGRCAVTASSTRRRLRGPWPGTSSTSARWAVATTGTPRRPPIHAAAQPSGTSMCAWITSNGQRPCTARSGPAIDRSIASAVAVAQPPAGQRELARVEDGDAVDDVDAPHLAEALPARHQRAAPSPWATPRARRGRARTSARTCSCTKIPPVQFTGAGVHVAEHQDADGDASLGSSPARRASTSAPIPRPNMIHIGAKWIAVDGPRLPMIQPISDSAPARDM